MICRCFIRTSAAPAITIEERPRADPSHARPTAPARPRRHGARLEELTASPRGGELDHAEWLGLLLDRELADRQDRRLKARLRYARLRQQATIEDVDYRTPRGLDRALFQKLALGGWIEAKQNLIIEGPTGVGKVMARLRART